MKKLLLLIAIIPLFLHSSPASAFVEPAQGTDNATDVVVWPGSDTTIVITGLEDALISGADEIADQMGTITWVWLIFAFLFGLAFLAYWRGDRPMFMLSGLGFLTYGFTFISTEIYLCIIMVLAGIFLFARAFTNRGIAR